MIHEIVKRRFEIKFDFLKHKIHLGWIILSMKI